jgi:circadian clock protein KaiA
LNVLRSHFAIGVFLDSDHLASDVLQQLSGDRYQVSLLRTRDEFLSFVEQEKQQLDCLILQTGSDLPQLANWLHGQAILLPAVFIDPPPVSPPAPPTHFTYHTAEVLLPADQLAQLPQSIEQAITQFIHLSPTWRSGSAVSTSDREKDLTSQNFLLLQQRRLTDKLKERLGYLGVYYKRNPQNFFRHLPPKQKQELLTQLRSSYRDIVLCYFVNDGTLNKRIDEFVNTLFFTDIAVSQVVEIHMDLMDEFSKQLKLEGRSEEILLDYRLTLIDTIAHLCEMYRRSIPRES